MAGTSPAMTEWEFAMSRLQDVIPVTERSGTVFADLGFADPEDALSRKPDEQYDIIEACSPGPYLELFARGERPGWTVWGNQAEKTYAPTWDTYAYNSAVPAE
jgi:hypothetical protein